MRGPESGLFTERNLDREWSGDGFALEMFYAGVSNRGSAKVAYRFYDGERLIFEGDDYGPSPCWAYDGDESVASLLAFLSLRPGDTDSEYFDDYTPEQLAWADERAEDLSVLAMLMEERANGELAD